MMFKSIRTKVTMLNLAKRLKQHLQVLRMNKKIKQTRDFIPLPTKSFVRSHDKAAECASEYMPK